MYRLPRNYELNKEQQMGSFSGRIAIVTGAASGIGECVARTIHALGGTVFLADVNLSKVGVVASELKSRAYPVQLDVRDAHAWQQLFRHAFAIAGVPDILVNAAGVLLKSSIDELNFADWDLTRAVNLDGVLLGSFLFLEQERHRQGVIVNLASTSSMTGEAEWISYCVSKGALLAATRAMSGVAKAAHSRVVALCPGGTDTPMVRLFLENDDTASAEKAWLAPQPLRRFASPQEIADVVVFAASDEASWLNGSMIRVDGGKLA
ncbi:hypothetical protein DOZ80_02840 [Pseudomonas fluorescens]|uniref:Uncharacterized protein n=2 Tax=Pseudomonas fluorescens TaxID=294 RepID=A0A327NED4_PSEFL|nr:hypothetical protein DOZ80_02840 [Pseudomonas fluorescens]